MSCSIIIAEFNPLSSGHEYIINKAKELYPDDKLVVIMSGNFVQRGEPAIINKFERAKVATAIGVDAVIELPIPFSISSAEDFAFGAIKIASAINGAKRIIFGSECGDTQKLLSIAAATEDTHVKQEIKKHLSLGNSYATSVRLALGKDCEISSPNNLLGIEYIKAISAQNSHLEPITIARKFGYNDTALHSFASASAIRTAVNNRSFCSLKGCLPDLMLDKLMKCKTPVLDNLFQMLFYKLQTTNASQLQKINGISEGLEYRIIDTINRVTSYAELIEKLKSKRYPESKICRILINILLSVSTEAKEQAKHKTPFLNVLAVGKDKSILKDLKSSNATLLTKIGDQKNLSEEQQSWFGYTLLADKIYAQLTGNPSTQIYNNKL